MADSAVFGSVYLFSGAVAAERDVRLVFVKRIENYGNILPKHAVCVLVGVVCGCIVASEYSQYRRFCRG